MQVMDHTYLVNISKHYLINKFSARYFWCPNLSIVVWWQQINTAKTDREVIQWKPGRIRQSKENEIIINENEGWTWKLDTFCKIKEFNSIKSNIIKKSIIIHYLECSKSKDLQILFRCWIVFKYCPFPRVYIATGKYIYIYIYSSTYIYICQYIYTYICNAGIPAAKYLHVYQLRLETRRAVTFKTHSCPPFQHLLSERLTSLGILVAPRMPPLNPSETIVLSAQSGERDQSVCMYVYIYLYIYICILHIYTQGVPKDTNTFQSIII